MEGCYCGRRECPECGMSWAKREAWWKETARVELARQQRKEKEKEEEEEKKQEQSLKGQKPHYSYCPHCGEKL